MANYYAISHLDYKLYCLHIDLLHILHQIKNILLYLLLTNVYRSAIIHSVDARVAELEKFKKGYSLGNNGYSSSIIMKTVESDIDGYNEFIVNEIDKFKSEYSDLNVEKDINLINKFCKMLLEKGEKYGFEIVKG